MDSKIGLLVQLAGVSLITLLTLFMRRSIKIVALKHWTNAWLFLSFALFCLRLAVSYEQYSLQLYSLYFFSQYLFGFLLVAGCKSLSQNAEMPVRQEAFVLPLILVAFALPFLALETNLVLNFHSLILSGFFLAAFIVLWRTRLRTFGWRVMLVALALQITDLFQFLVVDAVRRYTGAGFDLLEYDPVIDLVFQILLGFGMVIILLELVLKDAKLTNDRLQQAHKQLEELAHVDPLTTALNRHAFHGYVNGHGSRPGDPVSGCIGFFDIDDLKTVNDLYGHAVGDSVIRTVVRSIREIIRAEDLIFRWGGDEFFVLMIGLDAGAANERMSRLERLLTGLVLEGIPAPIDIGVSHAFENFGDLKDLEMTIRRADAGMYRRKQIRKGLIDENYPVFPDGAGQAEMTVRP